MPAGWKKKPKKKAKKKIKMLLHLKKMMQVGFNLLVIKKLLEKKSQSLSL